MAEEIDRQVQRCTCRQLMFRDALASSDDGRPAPEHTCNGEGKNGAPQTATPKQKLERKWRADHRNKDLLQPNLTWEQKVVKVLHMIRCQELTEYNPKMYRCVPTRFCAFNIAFFDLDKESEVAHGPLFSKIPESKYFYLDSSVNVISIKVAESDVPYPINIYGTVLARDQNDYRCVYLFKRGRDYPQLITSTDDTLTLTGPYRALSGLDEMFFEFNLKIKGEGAFDQVFSKGLLVRNACSDDTRKSWTKSLRSFLSKIYMVYTPISFGLQASVGVNILNGNSKFTGRITAWTTGNESRIILYDSEVAGTRTKVGSSGSISLTRSIVSVPLDENLVLKISVCEGDDESYSIKLVIGHDIQERTCMLGSYELQVKIVWTGIVRQQRPRMWKKIKGALVLW